MTNKRDGRTIEQVGDAVKDRRMALQMDQAGLARLAEVDAKTVRSLERGERWPRDVSRAKIEAALQWEPGSLEALLAGGDARSIDGLAGFTDSGEELFELPGARVYETLHYPDGRAYPVPSDLLDRAEEAREYMREHPEVDRQLRGLLEAIVNQADLATLQDRIRQLTRPQLLKLSEFVDRLIDQGETNADTDSPTAPQPGASSEAGEGEKTFRGQANNLGTRARNVERTDNDKSLIGPNQLPELDERRNEKRRTQQAADADLAWPAPDAAELQRGPDGDGDRELLAARKGETAEQRRRRLDTEQGDPEGPEGGA